MKIKSFLPALILTAVGTIMAALSWNKWADILVDFGRELYVPWQLNNGKVLYKDITHLYGPLSHYFNALLFKIFGTGIMTLAVFDIGIIGLLTYFIYRIFVLTADSLTATMAAAAFLSVFAFSQYVGIANYNFVCPYSHEIVHGIFLSFLAIYIFIIYLKNRRKFLLGILGALLGLVFLTKVEVFAAIFLAMFIALAFDMLTDKPAFNKIMPLINILLAGFLAPIIFFLLLFCRYMPLKEAFSLITLQYWILFKISTLSNIFFIRISGMDNPLGNAGKLLSITGLHIFALSIFFLISYAMKRVRNKKIQGCLIFIILAIFILSGNAIINKTPWLDIVRPLPLEMLVLGIFLFARLLILRENRAERTRLLGLLALTIFSFILLLKMLFNTHVFHYGFALAMPSALVLVSIILYWMPILSEKISAKKNVFRALGIILLCLFIIAHLRITQYIYSLKNYAVGKKGDTIMAFNPGFSDMGSSINKAILKINEALKENDTFVVLPEGVMLNYLTRHPNPCPYFEFTPPAIIMSGEDTIIEEFQKSSPDYIILTDKDTSECGARYFGQDYGQKIFSWIKDNYTPIYQAGSVPLSGQGFGVIIAKRNK